MLRLIVLTGTHLAMFACGVAIVLLSTHSRRQSLHVRVRALQVREIFVEDLVAGRRAPHQLGIDLRSGRHRASRVSTRDGALAEHVRTPRRSLLPNATLAETVAFLGTERARRVQDHRNFEATLADARRAWLVNSGRSTRRPGLI